MCPKIIEKQVETAVAGIVIEKRRHPGIQTDNRLLLEEIMMAEFVHMFGCFLYEDILFRPHLWPQQVQDMHGKKTGVKNVFPPQPPADPSTAVVCGSKEC